MKKKNDRSRSNRTQLNSQNDTKEVVPKVQQNSKLQKARFQGVAMQRQLSTSERSFVLSSITENTKSQKRRLSTQIFPSALNNSSNLILNNSQKSTVDPSTLFDNLSTKRNSDFQVESENIKSEKKPYFSRRKITICTGISIFLILLIILSIVLPLKLAYTNSKTTSSTNFLTTSQNLACTSGGFICSTPLFHWNYYCNPTSYNYYSCCYLSSLSTQLTISFVLQEDISHWSFDDISAKQNNGELITNGGFESNLNGWILTIPSNATSTTYVDNQVGSSHTGLAYLYGGSKNASAYLQQTFNVIQGQNINISFWWADGGSSVFIPGKICQAAVTLT